MKKPFDAIVTGSGQAGPSLAVRLASAGMPHGWAFDLHTARIQQKTRMINSDVAMQEACKFHAVLPVPERDGK
jgi:hypothetical protein